MQDTPDNSEHIALNGSLTPEQSDKLMGQRLYGQLQEVMIHAQEYVFGPNYIKFGSLRGFRENNRFAVYFSTYGLQHSELDLNGMMVETADYEKSKAEYAERVDVNTNIRIGIPAYTDLETREKYLEYIKDPSKHSAMLSESLRSYYFLDPEGNLKKIQQTDIGFDSGKPDLYIGHAYFTNTHGFESTVEKGDFELVHTALNLIDKFLTDGEEVPAPQR